MMGVGLGGLDRSIEAPSLSFPPFCPLKVECYGMRIPYSAAFCTMYNTCLISYSKKAGQLHW